MNLIVAVDNNFGIGSKNKLLISIKEDMEFFKNKTLNSVVIVGKNTLESFPSSKPLKNRINIVVAQDKDYKVEDAVVVNSLEDAVNEALKYNKEIYVIGGASIYNQLLDYCKKAYITKIYKSFDEVDTYIKNLDKLDNWKVIEESTEKIENDIKYKFLTYENKNTKKI